MLSVTTVSTTNSRSISGVLRKLTTMEFGLILTNVMIPVQKVCTSTILLIGISFQRNISILNPQEKFSQGVK